MHWPFSNIFGGRQRMQPPFGPAKLLGGQTQRPSELITLGGGQRTQPPFGPAKLPGGQTHAPVLGSIIFGGGHLTHSPFAVGLVPGGQTHWPLITTFGGGHLMQRFAAADW